eukprot:4489725-Lingulodinium_polyedra.AAC.1
MSCKTQVPAIARLAVPTTPQDEEGRFAFKPAIAQRQLPRAVGRASTDGPVACLSPGPGRGP